MSLLLLSIIIICVFFILGGIVKPIDVRSPSFKKMRGLLYLCVVLFTTQIMLNSGSRADLIRQFEEINELRSGGTEILQRDLRWSVLWGKYILFYLVSLQDNNMLLLLVSAVLTYGIVFYLWNEKIKSDYVSSYLYALSFLAFTSMCTFVNVTNSVRYPLASAIASLAVFLYSKHGKIFLSLGLAVLSLAIHQGTAIVFVIAVVAYMIKNRRRRLFLCIGGSMLFSLAGQVLSVFQNKYLNFLGQNISSYLKSGALDSRSFGVSCLVFSLLLTVLVLNNKNSEGATYYNDFLETLVFMSSACVSIPVISQRILLVIAINSLAIISQIMNCKLWKNKKLGAIATCMFVFTLIPMYYYDIYVFKNVYTLK